MAYTCQNFKKGQVLQAECLNKMDQALEEVCKKIDDNESGAYGAGITSITIEELTNNG